MKPLLTLTALIMALVLAPMAHAQTSLIIKNNGAKSKNTIKFSQASGGVCLTQTNVTSFATKINASSNTGDNTIKNTTGGTSSIVTGKSKVSISVTNTGGFNFASIECCSGCGGTCPTTTPKPTKTPTPSETPMPTPTSTPTPTPVCVIDTIYASEVESNIQGPLNSGEDITDPDRTDVSKVLGSPDGEFYSLGFGGTLVYTFGSPVYDLEGDHLSFHEITFGRDTYPEETAKVEVSQDGDTWVEIGEVSNKTDGTGIHYLDISGSGFPHITYVRLTDTTDPAIHDDAADGYDVDALNAIVEICE